MSDFQSNFDRRQFLKGLLGNLAQAAGTVVIASAAISTASADENQSESGNNSKEDVQERAEKLAASGNFSPEAESAANEFLNGGFRNHPLGAFRNHPFGAFRNTPLGAFRNGPVGGFRNHPFGGFGN